MISEAILIPKIYARLQEIASNFQNFLGEAPQTPRRRSIRGFAPLPVPLSKVPGSASALCKQLKYSDSLLHFPGVGLSTAINLAKATAADYPMNTEIVHCQLQRTPQITSNVTLYFKPTIQIINRPNGKTLLLIPACVEIKTNKFPVDVRHSNK